jgi:thiol:disulfide interchange protein
MRGSLWVICLAGLLLWGGQLETSRADGLPAYSLGYDPARDPFSDGRHALQLARETERMVLIEVGGDWCSWCHVLDRFLNQHPSIRTKLHERFVVLKVNVDDSNDNAEFLSAFPPALGYPHLYITNNDGSIVHSQDTAEFLQNGKYSQQRVLGFLDHWGRQDE